MTKYLNSNTKIGLTVGQLLSVIVILVSMFGAYGSFAVRIANIESKQINTELKIIELQQNLVKHEDKNIADFKDYYKENKADHQLVNDKLDKMMEILLKKK